MKESMLTVYIGNEEATLTMSDFPPAFVEHRRGEIKGRDYPKIIAPFSGTVPLLRNLPKDIPIIDKKLTDVRNNAIGKIGTIRFIFCDTQGSKDLTSASYIPALMDTNRKFHEAKLEIDNLGMQIEDLKESLIFKTKEELNSEITDIADQHRRVKSKFFSAYDFKGGGQQ